MSDRAVPAYPAGQIEDAEEPLLASSPTDALMKQAAFGLAAAVRRTMRERGMARTASSVLLLVGGGNNGADALYAGAVLARWGVAVHAMLLGRDTHARALAAARAAGVRCHDGPAVLDDTASLGSLARCPVWVDGITGIGARQGLHPPAAALVTRLAALRAAQDAVVVAVDVPSGIGVDDGTMPGPVLHADLTVTMGAAKAGLLLPPAALAAGRVELVEIGLELAAVPPAVHRLGLDEVAGLVPQPRPQDHKYRRGVLGLLTGSQDYPGAAVLSASGALGCGTGMVRYAGPGAAEHLVLAALPEVVPGHGRVQAWAMGSGIDPHDTERAAEVRAALAEAREQGLPVVLDAGAIAIAPPELDSSVVLTPHAGELAALLSARGHATSRADVEAAPAQHLRRAVAITGATVLLKGAITLVAAPGTPVYSQAAGTPWLATAGTGDVLTGVLGALLASYGAASEHEPTAATGRPGVTLGGDRIARIAAAAATVHGLAGRHASDGGPITAADVAAAVPHVVAGLLARRTGKQYG